ncbi:FAD/NAD(P)-binding protein [Nocardia amikacinitolerans]|uniref:FAD/NAD(P)-binding protein n=1 Tax=Nocardia amikacinitolerans TaxID=756689 RepID=UPI0020A4F07E|nr:FAD/NAD(P)-binding protein [Nocardia amikacinitolerans]MCP2280152.1 putative NAD(P)/FAD-binding protein YdhS [Nocardia amikacinitolerans]
MHIGIIGAGAAAVALLDALAAADDKPSGVTVFDGAPVPWRGRPYQPDLDAVRVNAPPPIMSVRAGDPGHYQRWLAGRDVAGYLDEGLGQPLVPRAVYGEYLEDTAREAIARLDRAGCPVRVVRSAVTGFSRDERTVPHTASGDRIPQTLPHNASGDRISRTVPNTAGLQTVLHTADGDRVPVDRAVLAVGGGGPRDHYGLTGAPGYVNEPYPLARTLAGLPADRHVAVIGSGLTAVDIAVALAANGHTGPISLLSRSGRLPFVQQRPVRLQPVHLTPAAVREQAGHGELRFAQLISLMRAELDSLGQDFDTLAAEITDDGDPIALLRRHLDAVDAPHLGRRMLAMAIRTVGPTAWPLLADDDREMLRTGHFRTINSLSSPMVPHNARIVLRLMDSGQLRLRAGLTKIEARSGGGFTVHDGRSWTADTVFNAVNPPAYTTPPETQSLISALLAAGAAETHPAGGLRAEPGSRRLVVGGAPDPSWHVLGNLAADSMFIATNPPGLAAEAAGLARALLGG